MKDEKSACGKPEEACTDEKCKTHGDAVQKRFRRTHVYAKKQEVAPVTEE